MLRNGPEVKIHILDDMVWPRGQAHGAISRYKRSLAEATGPDAEAHGVWARRQGLWRLVLESEWDSCLSGKTDFEGQG